MIITKELEALLEPGVSKHTNSASDCIQLSIAISLQRIHNKLEGSELGQTIYNSMSMALLEDYQRRS